MLGWCAVVGGYGMALWSLFSGAPSLGFVAGAALVGSLGWVLFVRPALVISLHGVHVQNPLRRTVVPWSRVQDVGTRWNLELYYEDDDAEGTDRHVTSWAIASHVRRPSGGGLLGALSPRAARPGRPGGRAPAVARHDRRLGRGLGRAGPRRVAQMVADRRDEVSTDGRIERTWDVADLLALGLPLLLVVVAIVL